MILVALRTYKLMLSRGALQTSTGCPPPHHQLWLFLIIFVNFVLSRDRSWIGLGQLPPFTPLPPDDATGVAKVHYASRSETCWKPARDQRASWSQTCVSVRVVSLCPKSQKVHHASKSEDLFVRRVHEPHWPYLSKYIVWPDLYLERWVVYVNMADVAEEDEVIACSSLLVAASLGAATI